MAEHQNHHHNAHEQHTAAIAHHVTQVWPEIVHTLCAYVEIPNQSPQFDPEWETNGLIDKAVELLVAWIKKQEVEGLKLEVIREAGRTPLIFAEVPAFHDHSEKTIVLYGHLDKQPPLTEAWSEGLHPYKPVLVDGKLYGRGSADDGYSTFSAITAIKALQTNKLSHPRCLVIIEAGEESGSVDLPYYIEKLADRIGSPSLVVCLDSGCGTYDRLWLTTSLRGLAVGTLNVQLLTEGVHSGAGTGIVASSFRVIRNILDRIEDSKTGEILIDEFHVKIPENREKEARETAVILGDTIWSTLPLVSGAFPISKDNGQLQINQTWKPTLAVTGAAGLPTLIAAGNVLRTDTSLKLSLRLPPTADAKAAAEKLKSVLEKDPPYGAKVTFTIEKTGNGWESPALSDWLTKATNDASNHYFKNSLMQMGEGGSIPFMGMLGQKFPQAQFLITGVLGPKSNAHGPNEFFDIKTGENVTKCVAYVLHRATHH